MPKSIKRGWCYWLIRDNNQTPLELVRANDRSHTVVAGEGASRHRRSEYFSASNKPNTLLPVSFELIHAGEASAPAISEAIEAVNDPSVRQVRKLKQYAISDAQVKALALLDAGSGVREAARLCGVPKSTVSDWRASSVRT